MVPLEAMASGLPVLISNVGAAEEIRRVIPEFVIDGYDDAAADEYVHRIELIMSRYEEFSLKARQYAQEYHSMARFKSEWLDLVTGIAQNNYLPEGIRG